MHTVTINKKDFPVPDCWNELTPNQLKFVIRLFLAGLSKTQIQIRSLLYMLGFRSRKNDPLTSEEGTFFVFSDKTKQYYTLSDDQLLYLTDNTISFLISETTDPNTGLKHLYLDTQLTNNPLPLFKHNSKTYYGPANNLFNLTFNEFIHCETFFTSYSTSTDFTDLDKLIAALYRYKALGIDPNQITFKGDVREPFNDFLIDQRAKELSTLSMITKILVSLYYQGCRKYLFQHFPHVFSGTSSKKDPLGYLSLVDALCLNDVTKTELVRSTLLFDVLVRLERSAIETEEHKRKIKSNS